MICTLFGRLIYTFPFIASVGKILEILAIGRTLESLWKIGSDKSENIQDRCLGDLCFHKSVLVNLQLKPSVSCQQVFHWLLPLCCGSCAWEKERLVACAGQLTSAFSSNASDSCFFFFLLLHVWPQKTPICLLTPHWTRWQHYMWSKCEYSCILNDTLCCCYNLTFTFIAKSVAGNLTDVHWTVVDKNPLTAHV